MPHRITHVDHRLLQDLDRRLVGVLSVSVQPLAGDMHDGLSASRSVNPDLRRLKVGPTILDHRGGQGFAGQPAPELTNSYGTEVAGRPRNGSKRGATKPSLDTVGNLPLSKEIHDAGEMPHNFITKTRDQGFLDVLWAQASRTRCGRKQKDG